MGWLVVGPDPAEVGPTRPNAMCWILCAQYSWAGLDLEARPDQRLKKMRLCTGQCRQHCCSQEARLREGQRSVGACRGQSAFCVDAAWQAAFDVQGYCTEHDVTHSLMLLLLVGHLLTTQREWSGHAFRIGGTPPLQEKSIIGRSPC